MALYKALKNAFDIKGSTEDNVEVLYFKELAMMFEDKFKSTVQHDAQEFMLYLFELMQ